MSEPWSREAAFVGRIAAGVTHEIRNVLAIVKESAGLIEDLLRASDQVPSATERMMRALARIEAQVGRGAEQLSHLNRFAHSLDPGAREIVDLREEVARIAFFADRVGRARGHRLVVVEGESVPSLRADALCIQMAIFGAVEHALHQLPDQATLDLGVGVDDRGRPVVTLEGRTDGSEPLPVRGDELAWLELRSSLRDLGVTVEAAHQVDRGSVGMRLVVSPEIADASGPDGATLGETTALGHDRGRK